MPKTQDELEQEIKKHQRHYLVSLGEDMVSARRALNAEKFPEIRAIMHRHAGAGGTMGFPEISRIAKDLEDLFTEDADPARVIAQKDEILERLARLEQLSR